MINKETFLSPDEWEYIKDAIKISESATSARIWIVVIQRSTPLWLFLLLGFFPRRIRIPIEEFFARRRANRELYNREVAEEGNTGGVFIFFSLAENNFQFNMSERVGLEVPRGEWKEPCNAILRGIMGRDTRTSALHIAIIHIGGTLWKYFPRVQKEAHKDN